MILLVRKVGCSLALNDDLRQWLTFSLIDTSLLQVSLTYCACILQGNHPLTLEKRDILWIQVADSKGALSYLWFDPAVTTTTCVPLEPLKFELELLLWQECFSTEWLLFLSVMRNNNIRSTVWMIFIVCDVSDWILGCMTRVWKNCLFSLLPSHSLQTGVFCDNLKQTT